MTAAELITSLEEHHSRTSMMSTAELYNLLPAIISALRGVEASREVVAVAKKILAKLDHPTATVTQWDADALRAALSQEEKGTL